MAEFLPISSSGHLTLLQHFFGMKEVDNLFNILLHFATLLAVCVVYWKDIVEMVVEFFRGFASLFSGHGSRESRPPTARRLVLMVIVGTLPLFVVLPLEGVVEQLGNYPAAVSVMLILTGFILFFSDRMGGGRKNARTATVKDALLVGIAQGVATIPGISRSGSTISAGMLLGFDRKFAVRYLAQGGQSRGRRCGHQFAAQLSGGHGGGRRGGVFLHPAGAPAGQQGQVRQFCILLLDRGRSFPGCRFYRTLM